MNFVQLVSASGVTLPWFKSGSAMDWLGDFDQVWGSNFLICIAVLSHSVVWDSLQPHGLYSPWNSPGQNTEMAAFPFSMGSSQPKDQAQVSRSAGGFFTS